MLRSLAAAMVGGGLLLVAGCDASQPDQLLSPTRSDDKLAVSFTPVISAPNSAAGARAITTVMGKHLGGAALKVDPDAKHIQNWYNFDVIRGKNGRAVGSFQFAADFNGIPVVLAGTIVCYTVVGNTARVGGIVQVSNFDGLPVGTAQTWSLTDNAGLTPKQPDTGSTFLGGDAQYATDYCANGLPYPENPFTVGGVTITY